MNRFARTFTLGIAIVLSFPFASLRAEESGPSPAKSGLMPAGVRPESPVTERELSDLLPRLAKRLQSDNDTTINVTKPTAPVTRMRALIATVKVVVADDEINSYREELPEDMPADTAQVPLWGRPYLAAAVVRGWWKADTAFAPKQPANWKFLEGVLAPICHKSGKNTSDTSERIIDKKPVAVKYTGLIVDATDFKVERSMSPRILDEEGQVVYPDPEHLPDIDYVQDHGILTYDKSVETAKRAGSNALTVKAIGVTGPGRTDIIVSKETAAQIREANKTARFLWKWAVSVISGTGEPKKVETGPAPSAPDSVKTEGDESKASDKNA